MGLKSKLTELTQIFHGVFIMDILKNIVMKFNDLNTFLIKCFLI